MKYMNLSYEKKTTTEENGLICLSICVAEAAATLVLTRGSLLCLFELKCITIHQNDTAIYERFINFDRHIIVFHVTRHYSVVCSVGQSHILIADCVELTTTFYCFSHL